MFVSFRVTGTQNLQEMISSTCHGVFWPAEDEGPTSWATQRIRQRPQRCTSTWHIFCHLTWTLCSLNCWSLDMFQLGQFKVGDLFDFFWGGKCGKAFVIFKFPSEEWFSRLLNVIYIYYVTFQATNFLFIFQVFKRRFGERGWPVLLEVSEGDAFFCWRNHRGQQKLQ